jgi:membrane-bound lytic murein transglycosylase B
VAAFRAVNPLGNMCYRSNLGLDILIERQIFRLAVLAGALLWGVALSFPAVAQQTLNSVWQNPDAKFRDFIAGFRTTAIRAGIDAQLYDSATASIVRNARVETLNLEQPEFVKPIWDYLTSALSPERIVTGQRLLADYRPMFDAIEKRFGVQREVLVAIWGIESDYGTQMGSFNIFEALATLAYDGPRADFGRRELLDALRIAQQEHLPPGEMTSSWAGASGQTQFVPSSFLRFAVDEDGDGRKDLWRSAADALASAANLLAQSSWEPGASWGYQVALPAGFPFETADLDNVQTITVWRNLGVRGIGGWGLPVSDARAAIYLPAGARGPAFIIFDNFRTLLKYNNAASYALAVCLLADRLKGYAPLAAVWPMEELPLARSERLLLQGDLAKLGFNPGNVDGIVGTQTRNAVRIYQKSRGLVPDGYASRLLLARIQAELGGH